MLCRLAVLNMCINFGLLTCCALLCSVTVPLTFSLLTKLISFFLLSPSIPIYAHIYFLLLPSTPCHPHILPLIAVCYTLSLPVFDSIGLLPVAAPCCPLPPLVCCSLPNLTLASHFYLSLLPCPSVCSHLLTLTLPANFTSLCLLCLVTVHQCFVLALVCEYFCLIICSYVECHYELCVQGLKILCRWKLAMMKLYCR